MVYVNLTAPTVRNGVILLGLILVVPYVVAGWILPEPVVLRILIAIPILSVELVLILAWRIIRPQIAALEDERMDD